MQYGVCPRSSSELELRTQKQGRVSPSYLRRRQEGRGTVSEVLPGVNRARAIQE